MLIKQGMNKQRLLVDTIFWKKKNFILLRFLPSYMVTSSFVMLKLYFILFWINHHDVHRWKMNNFLTSFLHLKHIVFLSVLFLVKKNTHYIRTQGGNGGFPGFRIPWEPHGNPGNLGNLGNPGNPVGIPGISWESWESWESRESGIRYFPLG